MDWKSVLGLSADIIGIAGAVFAFFAWRRTKRLSEKLEKEKQRLSRKVTVVLNHGQEKIELPVQLRRAELTRAEILGWLGMLPLKNKGGRFSLDYLSTPGFFHQINQIAEGTGDSVLTISCTKEEFDQFERKLV